jgi:hypothetical protein
MKHILLSPKLLLIITVVLIVGCQQQAAVREPDSQSPKENLPKENPRVTSNVPDTAGVYSAYAPVKIEILPLTEFVGNKSSGQISRLNVYVSLLDSFSCKVKSPGIFRIELYEFVQRSAEPKGQRLSFSPDIDLTDAARNNSYWRDFLRAYELGLDFQPQTGKSYVAALTFLCPGGKRLTTEYTLRPTK